MKNFTINYGYDEDSKQYIVEVPELNISDYGSTINEAYINLQAGLNLYFEEVMTPKKININKNKEVYA